MRCKGLVWLGVGEDGQKEEVRCSMRAAQLRTWWCRVKLSSYSEGEGSQGEY